MPADEYAAVARGPLKLKGVAGSKVGKSKKKKDKSRQKKTTAEQLEQALSASGDGGGEEGRELEQRRRNKTSPDGGGDDTAAAQLQEQQPPPPQQNQDAEDDEEDDSKTETERRFLETKRKRLKELAESGRVRPELLKTHKQRVEELNSALSRLSEHHDMPKIGPG
ncbi:hypothetical protein B0T24DRAFT_407961 [Lasiosphaeria ovina]|uniref:DUF1754-domain-containing protein n=1 Tax=Lasiosphaeria ovina TaxID=92902 RepID=A0AAE0N0Q4_9PEZI|nr:hypothetical protein B0T24DRAFT_407961 [Lasiosphaeria ovina]